MENSRLIEQYLLRYLAGTIFAFFILLYLGTHNMNAISETYFDKNETLSKYTNIVLFSDSQKTESDKNKADAEKSTDKNSTVKQDIESKSISAQGLVFLLVTSFLYMHISSMPLLFLHATRSCWSSSGKSMYEYHKTLSSIRSRVSNIDFVESYKRQRENGGAYGVMLFEILFAVYLMCAIHVNMLVPALSIWFLFGFSAWYLAHRLEMQLILEEECHTCSTTNWLLRSLQGLCSTLKKRT